MSLPFQFGVSACPWPLGSWWRWAPATPCAWGVGSASLSQSPGSPGMCRMLHLHERIPDCAPLPDIPAAGHIWISALPAGLALSDQSEQVSDLLPHWASPRGTLACGSWALMPFWGPSKPSHPLPPAAGHGGDPSKADPQARPAPRLWRLGVQGLRCRLLPPSTPGFIRWAWARSFLIRPASCER